MTDNLQPHKKCQFKTERLVINSVKSQLLDDDSHQLYTLKIMELLTPAVTKSLPLDWQNISSHDKASHWCQQRMKESSFLAIQLKSNQEIIGFVFLYANEKKQMPLYIHIGYLLDDCHWSKGYGNELIEGLVKWTHSNKHIHALIGGVEVNNIASIRVMEKNGFNRSNLDCPDENVIFLEHTINKRGY